MDRPEDNVRPWRRYRSRYLEKLGAAERKRIFKASERMALVLEAWAARYPLIRRVRILPLSLSVAAAAPFSQLESLVSTARVSLWVFALDDLFDEEGLQQGTLMSSAQRYKAIAKGETTVPADDTLADALREIRDDLASYPLFRQIGREWGQALCGTIDEMIREYRWRLQYHRDGAAMLPSYEEYIDSGRFSIGGPPHMWAAVITANDPTTPRYLDHLRSMEQIASICIRLANDLQTHTKEVLEGKVNSLIILSHQYEREGLSEAEAHKQAESRVRADISLNLEHLSRLMSSSVTETGQPELLITNIARFVCEFYTEHDFHTFSRGVS